MQKLQIISFKRNGRYKVALIRNFRHLGNLLKADTEIIALSPPLISTNAYVHLEIWKKRLQRPLSARLWCSLFKGRTVNVLPQINPSLDGVFTALVEQAQGRLLTERELLRHLRQQGYWPADISCALDLAVFSGELLQFPPFQSGPWGSLSCTRCGGERQVKQPCLNCGRPDCLACLDCSTLGEIRACSTFLAGKTLSNVGRDTQAVPLQLHFDFTAAQQMAAEALLEFGVDKRQKALVWAACGAGKTEVTFPLIQQALQKGQQVLFAIPRQDIVREMAQRLQRAFPQTKIAVHHGGKPRVAEGRLVVATTHQVLNFYHRFELAILDEVDAFPYHGSEMLRFGLKRAIKPEGKLVEMTATPLTTRGYDQVITIPARHHGMPLPVPDFLITPLPDWERLRAKDLPTALVDLLLETEGPWLIFAPTIRACEKLHLVLAELLQAPVGICHSKAAARGETVEQLKKGELSYVVSTSVLERGVTFEGVNVVVIYSDHKVFSTSTLIQMAGRVGRTKAAPTGTVLFVSEKKTNQMTKACELILKLNQVAAEKGLLQHGN